MNARIKKLVIEADEYLENGDPLKDVMDDSDLAELVQIVAASLREEEMV